jgi:hypothetical protein
MPIFIRTIARTTLSAVTPELLQNAIGSRLETLVGRYSPSDDDTPQQVLARLRVEGGGSFDDWRLTFSPGARPIRVQRLIGKAWETDRRAFFDEVDKDEEAGKRIRALLTDAKESVALQLSDVDAHGMAWPVAMAAAAALAKASDGLVRADGEGWLEVDGKDVALVVPFKG